MLDEKDVYRIKWAHGWRTLKYLYRHPHDAGTITNLIESMQGRSVPRLLERLKRRSRGRDLLVRRPSLRLALEDVERLKALPRGTLGREYIETIEGRFKGESMAKHAEKGETRERSLQLALDEQYIQEFLVLSHDIYHLVTGYQTDLVGEVCLLAFTAAQTRNTGVFAMMFLGMFALRQPRLLGQREALKAFVRALKARWLCEQDWVALLDVPIDEIREQLALGPAPQYTPIWFGKGQSRRAQAYREKQRAQPAAQGSSHAA